MHNKPKLVVKVTKTLRIEQNTIRVLLITSITALIISILFEYFGKSMICWQIRKSIHIEYLINIMLGLAASAFISFISLVHSYLQRKNERMIDIKTRLKDIYFQYKKILFLLALEAEKSNQGTYYSDNFASEMQFIEMVNDLENDIDEEIALYEKSELESDDFENINNVLKTKIKINISAISSFCSFLYNDNETKTDVPEIIAKYMNGKSFVEKDAAIGLANKTCYTILFNEINKKYSYNDFTELYKNILDPSDFSKSLFFNESKLSNDLDLESDLFNSQINSKILNAISDYRIALFKKRHDFNSRRINIEEKIREKNINEPLFLEKLSEIKSLIDKNEIEKYNAFRKVIQLLDQLEQDVENYDVENSAEK